DACGDGCAATFRELSSVVIQPLKRHLTYNQIKYMGVFHFLNVLEGDCSIIEHPSGHTTVIDVFNAMAPTETEDEDRLAQIFRIMETAEARTTTSGNFNQKEQPVNPVEYLRGRGVSSVFRFILTHPDMDHMGGIEYFFETFSPTNFWDTRNKKVCEFEPGSPYSEEDWEFYKNLRNGNVSGTKRLELLSGASGKYYNQNENGEGGGDGLYILAPTQELIDEAIESDDYNDSSYAVLYRSHGGRILISGDSHDKTWEHILENHEQDVANVDLLLAPHHGRDSGRSYDFLDTVNPKLTLFGNAFSEHLAYDAWWNKDLQIVTNNQAGCMIVYGNSSPMRLFVTNEEYARTVNSDTFFSDEFGGWYCLDIE
ncbi:ComEC/Rec2 family competence protein, partial [Salinibacter altiplanensis]|uniref:ComEC/Rec2 family competence protein n=1 Tax=Salinibacter altiplanensis TaxID=1803181 RepID=UPI0018F87A97